MRPHPVAVLFLLLLPLTASTGAAAVALSAGVAAADITPDPRMLNWTLPNAA